MLNHKTGSMLSLLLISVAPLAPANGQILGSVIPTFGSAPNVPDVEPRKLEARSFHVLPERPQPSAPAKARTPVNGSSSQILKLQVDAIEKLLSPLEVFQKRGINPELVSEGSPSYLHPIAGCYNNDDSLIQDLRISPVVSSAKDAKDFPKFALHGTVRGKPVTGWAHITINIDKQSLTATANLEGRSVSLRISNDNGVNPVDRVSMGGIATDANGKRISSEEMPDYLDRAETGYDWTERRKATLTTGIQKLEMTCSYLKSAELVIGTVAQAHVPKKPKTVKPALVSGAPLPTFEVFSDAEDSSEESHLAVTQEFSKDPKSTYHRLLKRLNQLDPKSVDEILRRMQDREQASVKRFDDMMGAKESIRMSKMGNISVMQELGIDPDMIIANTKSQITMIQTLNSLSPEELAQTFASSVAKLGILLSEVSTMEEFAAVMQSQDANVISAIGGDPTLKKTASEHTDVAAGVGLIRRASLHARHTVAVLSRQTEHKSEPKIRENNY